MSFTSGMASGLMSIGMGTPNFGATLGKTGAPSQCTSETWLPMTFETSVPERKA